MIKHHKILCPVDLSENSLAAIKVATMLAKQTKSQVIFIYVAPQWLPEEAMFGSEYVQQVVEEDKQVFEGIKPYADDVEYENLLVRGNPGPEIVRHSKDCDMVVMSTHGHSGVMRLLLGSVAQYVMRRADCPVISVRVPHFKPTESDREQVKSDPYVTKIMRQVEPAKSHESIAEILDELKSTGEEATPVVDIAGHCCGILTTTDIKKYRSLVERFEQGDTTVVDEMFEVDKYGQRRPSNTDFHQAGRHMTESVISIRNDQRLSEAVSLFDQHPEIHHLVVVDDLEHPVGILELADVRQASS